MVESPRKEETARSPRPTAPAPAPQGERTALLRRSATRGLTGLLALVLVLVLDVARRSGEAPPNRPASASPAPQLSAPPTAATLPPALAGAGSESPAPSSLVVDFEHGFKKGHLVLFEDDEKALEQGLNSRITGKFLGFARRRGRLHETLAVPPGRRQIRVELAWRDKQRSGTIVGTFKEGAPRRLVIRLYGLTKSRPRSVVRCIAVGSAEDREDEVAAPPSDGGPGGCAAGDPSHGRRDTNDFEIASRIVPPPHLSARDDLGSALRPRRPNRRLRRRLGGAADAPFYDSHGEPRLERASSQRQPARDLLRVMWSRVTAVPWPWSTRAGSDAFFSPDGRFVAMRGVDQKPAIFPVDGGAPLSIPGTDTNDYPGQWAGDGRTIYLYRPGELPCRVFRVDVTTGRRELYREIVAPDPAGLIQVSPVIPTHDGKAYAYSYLRVLSDLFLVEGLR